MLLACLGGHLASESLLDKDDAWAVLQAAALLTPMMLASAGGAAAKRESTRCRRCSLFCDVAQLMPMMLASFTCQTKVHLMQVMLGHALVGHLRGQGGGEAPAKRLST